MTTQTEALKLALEALEHCKDVIEERGLNGNPEFAKMWGLTLSIDRANQAITAIKEALAQPKRDLKPRCFADFQLNHEHDRKCQWCAVETECKTGMAQLEQEPVAYIHRNEYNEYRLEPHDNFDIKSIPFNVDVLLFKAPQRKPLTDEQILTVVRDHYNPYQRPEISFARAIEAAHGIKG